jgi:hypothetical protein
VLLLRPPLLSLLKIRLPEEEREKKELEEVERFFWRGRMIAKALDAEEAERVATEGNAVLAELDLPEQDIDAVLEDLQLSRTQEELLRAEAQQQQEFLDTLAAEFETLQEKLVSTETRRAELEAELPKANKLKVI